MTNLQQKNKKKKIIYLNTTKYSAKQNKNMVTIKKT